MSAANTNRAFDALTRAARTEHDFAGWLAYVLAQVAGQLGSADALTEGRPGTWESALVAQLVNGTVGYDNEALPAPSGRVKLTDAQVREIRDRYRYDGVTQLELGAEFGVARSTVAAIVTGKTWRWLA